MQISGLEKEHMINLHFPYIFKNIAIVLGCAIFFVSCQKKNNGKRASKKMENIPSQIIKNANIIKRDSGRINMRASAPLIEKYEMVDSPYVVARKGIHIEFYDKKKPKTPGTIDADSAQFSEIKKFYEAHGHVKIKTNNGKRFAMKSIYWDSDKKELYTQDTVYITDTDGSTLISTEGMIAKDDFSEYTFKNNSGKFSTQKIPQ